MLPEQSNGKNGHHTNVVKTSTIVNIRESTTLGANTTDDTTVDHADSDAAAAFFRNRWISFQDNFAEAPYRRGRRLHGLQLPLHPLQLFGWLVLVLFGCGSFLVLVPAFAVQLREPLYGLLTGLYIVHAVSHLFALLTDPADRELRRVHRNDRIVPEFDRKKHTHVIENGRCHLCNIRTTGQRTKHCSVCNKCVGKFDHHCKWLNHCVGGRNYVAFLMCVVSAVIATLVILGAAIAQIVLYHVRPDWLSLWHDENIDVAANSTVMSTISPDLLFNQTSGNFSAYIAEDDDDANTTSTTTATTIEPLATAIATGIGLHDTVFLVFIGFLGVLAAITAGLLLHLCFFHIYISFLGLTTYEYIRNHRQANLPSTQAPPQPPPKSDDPSSNKRQNDIYMCSSLKNPNLDAADNSNRPTTLHCCENSREYHQTAVKTYYMCSMLEADADRGGDFDQRPRGEANKTFHCCSQFARHRKMRKSGPTLPTVVSEIEATTTRSYMQFTEQCTFCTFRIKTPTKTEAMSLKTITKQHHRWRRKWNCCVSVPDSPDVPNDVIASIENAARVYHQHNTANPTAIPKSPHRSRLIRPWSLARFRNMLRAIRRPRCRHTTSPHNAAATLKQNQIRPMGSPSMILPTTIIRDPPALPPPTRRKMPNPTDLDELAETLGFSHMPSAQRLPTSHSIYRRHRRKHFLRTRSPTLSPIHESGLSNPTSPQPCRHATIGVDKICGANSPDAVNLNCQNGVGSNEI